MSLPQGRDVQFGVRRFAPPPTGIAGGPLPLQPRVAMSAKLHIPSLTTKVTTQAENVTVAVSLDDESHETGAKRDRDRKP